MGSLLDLFGCAEDHPWILNGGFALLTLLMLGGPSSMAWES